MAAFEPVDYFCHIFILGEHSVKEVSRVPQRDKSVMPAKRCKQSLVDPFYFYLIEAALTLLIIGCRET